MKTNNITIKKINSTTISANKAQNTERFLEAKKLGEALAYLGKFAKQSKHFSNGNYERLRNEVKAARANFISSSDQSVTKYQVIAKLKRSQAAMLSKKGASNCVEINVYDNDAKYSKIKDARSRLLSGVKEFRKSIRQNRTKSRTFGSGNKRIDIKTIAGCHIVPNEMLRFQGIRESYLIFDDKKPVGNEKHVGIEIEFVSATDRDNLAVMFEKAGLAKHVVLKEDGSLRGEEDYAHTHEVCVLAKETEYKEIVKRVTDVLNNADSKINKSCGLHVHLDMRQRDKELSFHNLVTAQSILYAMNPKSRRENNFAKKTTTKEFFSDSGTRYWGINPTAYSKHKTIEVRMHSGTIDYTKIVNWVSILLAVANKETKVSRATSNVASFAKQYGLSEELKDYINERVNKFSDANGPQAEEAA